MYHPFVCKTLFQLDPERVHEFASQQLRRITGTPSEALVRQKVPAKPVNCMGLMFKNSLGLAVSLDKDGECIDALGAMGFGSVEIGIVTSHPQPGNDKSRLFHLVNAEGSINRMGFNNLGAGNPVENIKKAHYNGVLGADTSKDEDTPVEQGKDDYLIYMGKIYAYAGYAAINISLLNTPGLRILQYGETLDNLLTVIKNKQNDLQVMYHKYVPIAVKIALDLSEEELIQTADNLTCHNINGVITTNITFDRSLVQGMKNCDQTGGLSGRPLQLKNTEVIRRLLQESNGRLPIIGAGSISSVIAVCRKIAADASLVQTYPGFVFKDLPLIREIVAHI